MTSTPLTAAAARARRAGLVTLITLIAASAAAPCAAETRIGALSLQNDFFVGSDGGGYTSGILLSSLRARSPGETGVEPPWLLAPLDAWLGLPKPALAATSLSQLIASPRDLSRAVPDPTDSPYVGVLALRWTQVHLQGEPGDRADLLAVDLGVIGPASGAAHTQRFVHRLTGSTRPEGWGSQVANRALLNLSAYRGWRFTAAEAGPSTDLVALAGGEAGNLQSSVGASLLLRYGTGLARSFPTAMRLQRAGDPIAIGAGWFAFGGVSADRLFNFARIGSDGPAGNSARLQRNQLLAKAGLAYGAPRWSVSLSVQDASPLVEGSGARHRYGSITYTRFLD